MACFQWRDDQEANPLPENCTSQSSSPLSPSPPTKVSSPSLPPAEHTSHTPHATHIDVRVFNITLMCQKPYTIDPSSSQFLLRHGFDFNKQVSKGIPYSPGPLRDQTLERGNVSLHILLAAMLARGKPIAVHNGWMDLLFLYRNFYAPLPPSLETVIADMSEMFECGVYDTKAIATFAVGENATFLEYLFRKW